MFTPLAASAGTPFDDDEMVHGYVCIKESREESAFV